MFSSHYTKIGILALSLLLSSCLFMLMKKAPVAKQCYFNPADATIYYKGEMTGIAHIRINLLSSEEEYLSSFLKKDFTPAAETIDLSVMDTAVLKKHIIYIKIWDRSPVLEDYDLTLRPEDWNQPKKVYSRYNVR